jgi:hypothetical protein
MVPLVPVAVATGLLVIGFQLGSQVVDERRETARMNAMPLVLERVQGLGELRTARHHYQNVFEYDTHREPSGWARMIPGVTPLVHSTTLNRATLSMNGSVDAGFDLTKAKAHYDREHRKVVVRLPRAEVYEPVMDTKVHSYRRGVFWTDANLGLKANAEMGQRLRRAGINNGLRDRAETEAVERIRALVEPIVDVPVEVAFS